MVYCVKFDFIFFGFFRVVSFVFDVKFLYVFNVLFSECIVIVNI